MITEMANYFSSLSVHLVTGRKQIEVIAISGSSAHALVRNEKGDTECMLTEIQVSDILRAMKRARRAAKSADDLIPYESRDKE